MPWKVERQVRKLKFFGIFCFLFKDIIKLFLNIKMENQILIRNLNNIKDNFKPKTEDDLQKLYCNIMIYKNDIKNNVSKQLFDKYKKETDDFLFEFLFFDNNNDNNNDKINKITSNFLILIKEIIEYLKSNFKFNEDKFISSILNEYYKNNFEDFTECLEIFLDNYTKYNSIDYNKFLINKYSNINDAIILFKEYYKINFNLKETKTDYDDLAAVVLFHNFYNKIYDIIIDNDDSANDTE
jgi:hypothetical protein